jgi:hypothetical protein
VTSQKQRPSNDNTKQSQQTDIHALGGIRTRNPSKRVVADPRLRPRGHWDQHSIIDRETVFILVNNNNVDNNNKRRRLRQQTTTTTTTTTTTNNDDDYDYDDNNKQRRQQQTTTTTTTTTPNDDNNNNNNTEGTLTLLRWRCL